MFKKFYLITVFLAVFVINCISQNITNYSFAANSGTFTPLSGATIPPGTGTGTVDEGIWNTIPIGFNFWYMGTRYTTLSASTNGWLTFGANIINPTPANSLSGGGSPRPILAPLWDDLDIQAGANTTYLTTGTAGNQVFTIQFLNYQWDHAATGNTISFQVKLYESTGKIQYIYRQESGAVSAASASIGIAATSTGAGNFLSVNNAGTSVSSTTEANVTTRPLTGNTYSFTPPIPLAPGSLTFSAIGNNSETLNWADLSSNETGFLVYKSTDGVNYTFTTQTAANTTTSVQSGLNPSTSYYWKVYAVSEGGLSNSALSGTQSTTCTPPAAPTVSSPVNYCQNATATALTATGTNLLWGGAAGSVGGTAVLTTTTYLDNAINNKKTNFTTGSANVTISTVDYYIPANQTVNGLVLAIFNSSGTVIATSTTTTTLTAGASVAKITNTFNFPITAAGDYSIGVSSGTGSIGSDNPSFPITETTGTINITGVSAIGLRCFNNIQFTTATSATAPIPSTTLTGSTNYFVSQTASGCVSPLAAITVNVAAPNISQIPLASLVLNYKFNGNANDESANNNTGTLQSSPALTADRFNSAGKAYTFNGSTQYVSTLKSYVNPTSFTMSVWFKTSTSTGGKLIGFGSAQTGGASQYDRHIYMNNAGQLYFGIYSGTVSTVNSPLSYNDNTWHLATASLSPTAGMVLYIDGIQVAVNTTATAAENYTGYWMIGYGNNSGWTSQPSSFFFNGSLDDALVYNRVITPAEAGILYTSPDGAGNNGPTCTGAPVALSATTVSGATYSWTGPNSYSSTSQNPAFNFATANTGIYTLVVTVVGCTATAFTNLAATNNSGQWTGNVSTDWSTAGNWCTGVVPNATTNVTINSGVTNMPSIISTATCKDLTIKAGATLTTPSGGILNIGGLLTNSGTMNNDGTTNFNGTTGQQTFSAVTVFNNLTLNNTNGLLLPAAITIKNNLTINSGILNTNNFGITIAGNWINNFSTTALTAGTAIVSFNGVSGQSIGGLFATTFNNLTISNTVSSVTLNVNAIISGDLSITSGTFDLAAFTANRPTAGGTLSIANNTTLKIGGTNTYPANYSTNTLLVASTVEYSGTNQSVANQVYGNLKLSSSSGAAVKTFPATALAVVGNLISTVGTGTSVSFTAASNITVSGKDSIGASTTFNGGSFSHTIGSNWVNNGTFNGNTSTITFIGPASTISGTGVQNFNSLTVAASFVVISASVITLTGNLATTGAGAFSQVSGGTILMSGAGTTISGTGISPDNLTISGTVSTNTALTITGNLSITGSLTASAGTITMSGVSKTISGAGAKNFATLFVTGAVTTDANFSLSAGLSVSGNLTATAGTATFTGTSTLSGTPNLFNATINGTSLQLSANSIMGIANVVTITTGVLNVTSTIPNTINFNGTGAQNINAITYCNLLLSNGNTKTAAGNITTNFDVNIGTGTTFNPVANTISVYGNWINSGTFSAASSTVQFLGPATAFVTGVTTFNILTSNTTNATTQLILNNNISAATVNMTKGIISTGSNTITITNTRTGSGYIYGNIQRTHAFTTGVAYAFEGPDNTITFSSVSSVSSITVSVVQGGISDFPFGGSISRVYNIIVPSGTYNATLRLHYEDGELNGNNESLMGLWNFNGTAWGAIGKTANSTTANYVEQSGLTNITNRWTCSDNTNVVQWNGSTSTDWNTAANWTVLQGSGSRPPGPADIVNVGTAAFTYQPTINNAVTVKSINFGSVQAVALSMGGSGSLITGDIHGTWGVSITHNINVNNQTITVNGDFTLSDGIAGHAINVAIGSGTVNVADAVTQSGGANIVFSGAGNLNIGGDYNYISGTFTPATAMVTYNGILNQVVGAVNYNNLTINKSAAFAAINNTVTIGGNLAVTAGQLENFATTTITGNVDIATGANMQNFSILHVGGNWNNNGNFTASGAKIFFDGTGTQTISATTFNNFNVNKPVGSTALLTGDISIKGDFTITSGTLDIKSFNSNRSSPGGTLTLGDAATLIVGANNSPLNFSNGVISNSSTVIANGTGPQSIFGVNFGNIIFRNGGLKTLVSPITVNGDLTIESGASFDGGSQTLTLNGNWINAGTFIPSTSTLSCNGNGKNITGNTIFNRVTIYGSYTILNNVTFNGLLNITSLGSLSGGSTIITTLNSDLVNSGILYTLGTTTFTGNVLQTLSLINAVQTVAITVNFNGTVSPVLNSTSPPQYGYLNINNTGGVNPSVGWTIAYALTVGAGASFNGGISTHNILGSVTNNGTITSSGILNFIPATPATLNLGTNFTSTGRVIFGGAGAMTMAGTPASFHNVVISNTNVAGVTPSSGWITTNNFKVNTGSILNAGNFNYTIGGDLSNTGTINSGTSTITLNGSIAQDVFTNSPFNNLTINNTAGLINLSSNTTVNGVLNFITGKIQTGSNVLIQPSTGTVTGVTATTGWVNGKLQKNIATGATTKIFEVGDATNYTPVSVAFSSVSTPGNLTVFTTLGDHPNLNSSKINPSKSVNRFWTLSNNGITFTSYNPTFNFAPSDIDAGASTPAFGVGLYNGTSWVLPAVASPNPTNIQATGVNSTGDFAIGEICNAGTTIAYPASPYCTSAGTAAVTLNGNGGGTYTSTAGLSIGLTTGTINLASSTPGSYIVTYKVNATGGCADYITTANIIISGAANATISYAGNPYCSSAGIAVVTLIGTAGGSFSATGGLLVDPITGDVNPGTNPAGTYTVTYTVNAAGGCGAFSTTTSITLTTQPFANGTYTGNPYCTNGGTAFPTGSFVGSLGTLTSTAGLSIDPSTGVITLASSTPGIYTVNYNVAASGGCPAYSNTATVSIVTAGTWTGVNSSSWTDGGNWLCGAVPVGNVDISIPGNLAIYPVITGTNAANNITILAGGILTVTGGTLQIAGTISNAGTFDVSGGTIDMNGSSPQTIPANAFANNNILHLTINNNVTLAGQDTLRGTLTIGTPNKTFATGGFLNLGSSATDSAAKVAPLPVNGAGAATSFITGLVTVERFIPGKRAWRLLTAPLSATGNIFNSWQNGGVYQTGKGMFVTGPNPGSATGLDASGMNKISMKSYNATTQNFLNTINTKTTNLSNNSGNADNVGYFAFVRGDRNPSNLNAGNTSSTTLRSTGLLQTGKQVFAASDVLNTFTIMGNPYASPVDFNNIERTHLIKRFYAWDPTVRLGNYIVLDDLYGDGFFSSSDPGSLMDNHIQSGQAFFVQTDTAGAASLTYYESSKSTVTKTAGFRPLNQKITMTITLNLLEEDQSVTKADADLVEFSDKFSAGVNLQDALKFTNINETLGLLRDGKTLAIERRPVINKNDTLFFRLTQTIQRNYQLVFNTGNLHQPSLLAYLEDNYTHLATPVSLTNNTSVNFSIDADSASMDPDRFRLVFKQSVVLPVTYRDVKAWQQDDDIMVQWMVENQLNIKSYDVEKSTDGINFVAVNTQLVTGINATAANYNWLDKHAVAGDNFYRIRNLDDAGNSAYSKVVKVNVGKSSGEITIYPNPVTGGVINLQFNNMAAGRYKIRLLNAIGQALLIKEIYYAGGNASEKISLSKYIAKGIFKLEIINPGNSKSIIEFVNQP